MRIFLFRLMLRLFARKKSYNLVELGGFLVDHENHWEIYFPGINLSIYCCEQECL